MSEIRKKQLKIALFNTYFPLIKKILIILNENNNNNNQMHNYVKSSQQKNVIKIGPVVLEISR